MSIKTEIVKNWDKDYTALGSDTFEKAWLDDPLKVTRLAKFIFSMHGIVCDSSHHLAGDERAKEIDRVQNQYKDSVWERTGMSRYENAEAAMETNLADINRYLIDLKKHAAQ